ncbi:hypothetical protein PGT21_034235 [Puccinia graminis f. sp. tritici]|uniref:Uncharacterized protein n=2 Tax=Puccinia graminis f. sp. tritici TaxID=56615 RepID=A0A5B0P9U4_PUCGR|nr:hypothetical protein PGT21_033889 [Puccinia graminis f. sp. tritici]KAA1101963.1 hypothetical protein PGT21_034235 [Puccinia graminis f. sp. tritici]
MAFNMLRLSFAAATNCLVRPAPFLPSARVLVSELHPPQDISARADLLQRLRNKNSKGK